jgi:hypothetical protein
MHELRQHQRLQLNIAAARHLSFRPSAHFARPRNLLLCRYVLEMLAQVYGYDAEARERSLTPEERLQFHQAHSSR